MFAEQTDSQDKESTPNLTDVIKDETFLQLILRSPDTDLHRPRPAMMLCFTLLTLLCCGFTSAEVFQARSSSFSSEYGGGGGKRFSHSRNQLDGPITAIRIRASSSYITGIQVRYGKEWSEYQGGSDGDLEEIVVQPGESVIRVQGTYRSYLRKLVFITDKGRNLPFGKGTGTRFNAAPMYPGTVLRYISGSSSSVIDAISFHWDNYPISCPSCGK